VYDAHDLEADRAGACLHSRDFARLPDCPAIGDKRVPSRAFGRPLSRSADRLRRPRVSPPASMSDDQSRRVSPPGCVRPQRECRTTTFVLRSAWVAPLLRRRGDRAGPVRLAPCRTIGIARAVRMGAGARGRLCPMAAAYGRRRRAAIWTSRRRRRLDSLLAVAEVSGRRVGRPDQRRRSHVVAAERPPAWADPMCVRSREAPISEQDAVRNG
jgi:hypothetical protein